MEKQYTGWQLLRDLALIVLVCAPLCYIVFVPLAHLSTQQGILQTMSWGQMLILVACVVFPLLVLPRLGVNWSRDRDLE